MAFTADTLQLGGDLTQNLGESCDKRRRRREEEGGRKRMRSKKTPDIIIIMMYGVTIHILCLLQTTKGRVRCEEYTYSLR